MIPKQPLIIAVDFDGTIVKDKFPEIGQPQIFAFETLRKMQEHGHRLILWTLRDGRKLQEAVDFCKRNGVEFYAINQNYPEEIYNEKIPRKIYADLFIDDRNIGGFVGWGTIHQLLFQSEPVQKTSKGFFGLFK